MTLPADHDSNSNSNSNSSSSPLPDDVQTIRHQALADVNAVTSTLLREGGESMMTHLCIAFPFIKSAPWSFLRYLRRLQRQGRSDDALVQSFLDLTHALVPCHSLKSVFVDWSVLHYLRILDDRLEECLFQRIFGLPSLTQVQLCGRKLNVNTHLLAPTALMDLRHAAQSLEVVHLDERGCLRIDDGMQCKNLEDCLVECQNLKELYIGNLYLPRKTWRRTTVLQEDEQRPPELHGLMRATNFSHLETLVIKQNLLPTPKHGRGCLIAAPVLQDFLVAHSRLRTLTLQNLQLDDRHCQAIFQAAAAAHVPLSLSHLNLRGNAGITNVGRRCLLEWTKRHRQVWDVDVPPSADDHGLMAMMSVELLRNRSNYKAFLLEDDGEHRGEQWCDLLSSLQAYRPRQFADIEYEVCLTATYLSILEHPHFCNVTRK